MRKLSDKARERWHFWGNAIATILFLPFVIMLAGRLIGAFLWPFVAIVAHSIWNVDPDSVTEVFVWVFMAPAYLFGVAYSIRHVMRRGWAPLNRG